MKSRFYIFWGSFPIIVFIILTFLGCRFLEMTDELGPDILGDPIPLKGISYYPWNFDAIIEVKYDEDLYSQEDIDNLRYYFASRVVYFLQAPGKFANSPDYGMGFAAGNALGPPMGGGALSPGNSSIVTLGLGGGEIILEFDEPIQNKNDTVNYKGYDFIVFGNAYWTFANPGSHFQEPGVIWVGVDDLGTGNFLDAKWYVIPGSEITQGDQKIAKIYNSLDVNLPPVEKEWYPDINIYKDYPGEEMILEFFSLNDFVCGASGEEIRGYCDVTPTLRLGDMSGAGERLVSGSGTDSLDDPEDVIKIDPCDFYTIPNNSENWTVVAQLGIDPGSGGGDAIDIDWARDPEHLNIPTDIDEIRWVRIVSASTKVGLYTGDISTEVDAVARVREMSDYNPEYNYTRE